LACCAAGERRAVATDEPPLLPQSLRGEARSAPGGKIVVTDAIVVESASDIPYLALKQDSKKSPETPPPPTSLVPVPQSSTGTPANPPAVKPPALEVAPAPLAEEPYPIFYRDRPEGSKAQKAATIAHNRGSEPNWYREWRCTHYGYYPTQWRPWPEGWHLGRNLTPPPHPYDIRQPDPVVPRDPERMRRDEERRQRDRDQIREGKAPPPPLGGANPAKKQP
jgi:hypothetical protein